MHSFESGSNPQLSRYSRTLVPLRYDGLRLILFNVIIETSRGAGAQSVTVKPTGCGFRFPLEEILKIFIFPFLCSGVKKKRGVEFCHSTRNASRIEQKMGNTVSYH